MFNDRVIANSAATAAFQRRFNLVRRGRMDTIHCFVDMDRFSAVPPSCGRAVRAEFGLTDEHLVVGQIGYVCPRKGLLHLVRALPDVLVKLPQARLLVVGDHQFPQFRKYVDQVRREARRLNVEGRMIWAGHRHDIPQVLSALDVFAQASLEEAQGIAVLEAMVRAVPVVATAVGGVVELVQPGQTGVLVPPANPAALARGILRVLGDPQLRQRVVAGGRELVRQRFSPASQVPRVEAVLADASRRRAA
jgi:glycosyltransferase involved in cell wall biosynthesis